MAVMRRWFLRWGLGIGCGLVLLVSCAARLHDPSILLESRLADGGEVELMYVICRGEVTNPGIASC